VNAPTSPASASAPAWTIRGVLAWAAADFRRRGIDSPRLDAELLLAHVLGVDRIRLILDAERPLEPAELEDYRAVIQRRRKLEPIAYILGTREFYGLPIRVDPRVLIPRPDTEVLVDVGLARTRARNLSGHALDLCTGSGCVAIAFARQRPLWRVTAVDLSPGALEVARDNALRLGAIWGVDFIESDLDAALASDARFDLITANPPYITDADLPTLQRDIVDHEPHLALTGGSEGLDIVRRIAALAPRRLRACGVLAIEVGAAQAAEAARLLRDAGLRQIETARDLGGIERVVSGELPAASRP
jgi:release factor glutamine methyltransferase